jgi:hypothetical protein
VSIPDRYHIGHEAHFGEVMARFLSYLRGEEAMPSWERPNMVAKYHVTTQGVKLAQEAETVG